MKRSCIAWVPWVIVKVTLHIIKTVTKALLSAVVTTLCTALSIIVSENKVTIERRA